VEYQPKLSAMTYVFAKHSLEYTLFAIADCGLRELELWGGYPHAAIVHMGDNQILETRNLLNRYGLEVVLFTPQQLNVPVAISSHDENVRKYSIGYFKKAVDIAAKLGSPRVLLNSGACLLDADPDKALHIVLEGLKEICVYAGKRNIAIVLEPVSKKESPLIYSLSTLKTAYDYLAPYGAEAMVDLIPLFLNGEDLASYFEAFGSRLSVIHFIDCDGKTIDHLIPGEGVIDFQRLVTVLKKYDFSGTISFELGAAYLEMPTEALRKTIHRTRRLFGAAQ